MEEQNTQTQENLQQESVIDTVPVLELPIEDIDLIRAIDERVRASNKYYDKIRLKERTERNIRFYTGDQLEKDKMEDYEADGIDNMIWQDLETRLSIASARLPDIIIVPSNDDKESRDTANQLETGLNIKLDDERIHSLIKDGLRDNHLKFRGIIKVRWDPNRGPSGDYLFELIDPMRVIVDHSKPIPHDGYTSDNCGFIAEWIDDPLSVVLAKFPDKRDEILKVAGIVGTPSSRQMDAMLRYQEVWFTWYDKAGKRIEGTMWRFGQLVFGKMRNPYWDWEGVDKIVEGPDGQPKVERKLNNYFERPRKPYIFMNHVSLRDAPIDTTTPVEQAIPLQKQANKRQNQISNIADNAVPKRVFGGQYISKEQAETVTNDPKEGIWLETAEDVRMAFSYIPGASPPTILYNDLMATRAQIDSKFNTHGVTRGETTASESGVSKSITREGDLSSADDIVGIMVERAVAEMAGWSLQMIKSQYDKPHNLVKLGTDGEMVRATITSDSVMDGIKISVKASSTDKATRRTEALNLAGSKAIDPLTMFEEMDVPNPKERTKRLIAFMNGAQDAYATYLRTIGVNIGPDESETPTAEDMSNVAESTPAQPESLPDQSMPVDQQAAPNDLLPA